MSTKKIEQLSRIVEYCLEKLVETECTVDLYLNRYHLYHIYLLREVNINLNISPYDLNVSEFMRSVIIHHIEECLLIKKRKSIFENRKKKPYEPYMLFK